MSAAAQLLPFCAFTAQLLPHCREENSQHVPFWPLQTTMRTIAYCCNGKQLHTVSMTNSFLLVSGQEGAISTLVLLKMLSAGAEVHSSEELCQWPGLQEPCPGHRRCHEDWATPYFPARYYLLWSAAIAWEAVWLLIQLHKLESDFDSKSDR